MVKYELSATLHGFRASFKSACVDKGDELLRHGIGESISEMVLHHSTGDSVAKAYNRAKAAHLKTLLMKWWCEY